MKILHVVHEFAPFQKTSGGTGRYVYQLVHAQIRLGHSVTVLTQQNNPDEAHLEVQQYTVDQKIPVHKINISRFEQPEQLYRRDDLIEFYQKLTTGLNVDAVHVHHFIGLSGSITESCKISGIPYGITFHDFWPFCIRYHMIDYGRDNYDCARQGYTEDDCVRCIHQCHFHNEPMNGKTKQFLSSYLEARNNYFAGIIAKASFVTGPSYFIKKIFDEKYHLSPDKFMAEPLGMEFGEPLQNQDELPWVQFGYIGSIEKRKGLDLLLNAFQNLPYPLHLWGHDPREPAFQEYAKTRPNLHYHGGYESLTDLDRIFSMIHLCIVPSLSESFGITARESLAYCIPVIISNWGGMPEAVIHQRNGLLFEVNNEGSLREAIQYAADHPAEITEMKKHTRDKLVPMNEHALRMISLYESSI